MSASDQLTALDATFLELEQDDESALMHIGSAMVFEPGVGAGTPTIAQLRTHLGERLGRLPRYRQKLGAPRTGGLSWPYWEDDPRFEIEAHVRHATLPPPGEDPELLDWVSDFYSHRLDRHRPLWEIVLLDGLAGGRWALVTKTHHCLVDGIGSVGIVDLLLNPRLGPTALTVPDAQNGMSLLHVRVPNPPAPVRQAAGAGLTAARAGAHALLHPRETLERSREVIDLLIRDELFAAPRSSINVPIGATRRIDYVRVELDELHAIRRALGGKLNDVVLSIATGGLRALLLARGEELPGRGLRAMVPVNIRREADNGELGNKISSLFIELPVAEADPLRRHELVAESAAKRKESGQAYGAGALVGLTELAPPLLHASLARSLYAKRLFNITITNVPGRADPPPVFGGRIVDLVPIVPLAAEHALGIVVVSFAGKLVFGLCADRATVPDFDVFKRGIIDSLDELRAMTLAMTTTA
ncbi:MAG: wax ester/triacylglycerol synthase family O-acyltransferase [Solirubrobacteraceae bacterium]|jgi:WS/DGAT/MGAT family acyltransferase